MPDETSIWTDVRFNQVVAHEAAEACERTARLLRETTSRRRSLAASTLAAGRGPWRDQLAARLAVIDRQSAELDTRLRGLANALFEAAIRARADQSRRETARTTDLGHPGTNPVPG